MAMEHAVQEGIAIHVGALPQNVIILGYSRRLSFSGSIRRLGDILGVTIDFKVAGSVHDCKFRVRTSSIISIHCTLFLVRPAVSLLTT